MELLNSASATLAERLLEKRRIRVRKRWAIIQLNLWLQQGWVTASGEGIYQLTQQGEPALRQRLQLCAPPSPELMLQQLDIQLPEYCNRRIASLLLGQDHLLSEEQLREYGVKLIKDSYLLLRCNLPCSIFMDSGELIDVGALFRLWKEVVIPERMIADIRKILWKDTPPTHVITVDDRDAFVSLSLPSNSLLVHAPRKNTGMAELLLQALTDDIKWSHFGNVSPEGICQAKALAERLQRPLSLYLPQNWAEFLRQLGQPLEPEESWPVALLTRQQQISLQLLIENRQKLPQEFLVYAKNWLHIA